MNLRNPAVPALPTAAKTSEERVYDAWFGLSEVAELHEVVELAAEQLSNDASNLRAEAANPGGPLDGHGRADLCDLASEYEAIRREMVALTARLERAALRRSELDQ